MYKGLAAYRVLSWIPPQVICWTREEDCVPEEYRNILEDHLLHIFEDKANNSPEFLLRAQR